MAFGRVATTAIEWTRASPTLFASSTMATRGFCSACGTPLTYQWKPSAISVTLGSLDEPDAVAPVRQYAAKTRLPWLDGVSALPNESTDVFQPSATGAGAVSHQHPDHDT